MERWIRLQLADQMGIFAGVTIESLSKGVINYCGASSPPSKLSWTLQIDQVLEREMNSADFAPVKRYVRGQIKRRLMLAKHLAYLFERYSIYGVATWKHKWQKKLWNKVGFTWNATPTDKPIHLFGFSHIPEQFFHLFHTFFYFLSPCREFWSDSVEHPLLSDLGYVGRELSAQVEESQIRILDDYSQQKLSPTQHSMLNLSPLKEDETIEIHTASTRHREVEICYNNLLSVFDKVSPREILVMAPNISEYASTIQAVFGSLCQITDLPKMCVDFEVQGLNLLFELHERRFCVPALLDLFAHPLFQKKRGWNEQSILQIRRWMESTGMRWGVDGEHRKEILGIDQEETTIVQGVNQLLEDLAYGSDRIDLASSDLLGTFAETVEALYSTLSPFYDGQERSLKEWVMLLKSLYETHFTFDRQTLFPALDKLNYEGDYSGEIIRYLLHDILREQVATYNPNEVEAVRFCSLLPMRAIPAKVIYLLGMNQGKFPRQKEHFSLDELEHLPSQTDFDRYLFLETLLSYREKLFISYLDHDDEPASCVVQKIIAKKIVHPACSYDPSYFTQNNVLKNYSQTDFALASALQTDAQKPPLFEKPKKITSPLGEHLITLAQLQKLIRSPLSHYYNEINFFEEASLKEDEEFTLSPLLLAKLRRFTLKMPLEDAVGKLKSVGNFPLGSFETLAKEKIHEVETESIEIEYELSFGKTTIHLTGVVEGVLSDGFFRFDKPSFANAIKHLPAYLLFSTQKKAPLILGEKYFEPFFDTPDHLLQKLIEYYFLAKKQPSPLFPLWVEKGEFPTYDLALNWSLQTHRLTDDAKMWEEVSNNLFKEMKHAWF